MRILVTGAGGAIGGAATAWLVRTGHEVRALVREDDTPPDTDGVEVERGDATDPTAVSRAVTGVDAVVHLAATPAPLGRPEDVFVNNSCATLVVLQYAAEAGVGRAVIASSVSALGLAWAREVNSPAYVPIDEDHPFWPEESYGLSKQVDEATAAMIHRRFGMPILAYRFPFTTSAKALAERAAQVRADPAEAVRELWAYLDLRDAAEAIRLGVESGVPGFHPVYVMAPDTLADRPTAELIARYHPGSEVRTPLVGRQTPYVITRAEELLGFHARHLVGGDR
ncbi:NAD-dependent epimerase/dehydratase family protein [Actinopolymorpha rutila]|uniref:Nucleoside-diphosphate-sugar epimerase n=1 Tax=Actinopolymorpha rutila TaxID=446787 RepID=A0A852ZER2_9ACTN|nr:NAD(P)-dependent oxidoreductase [Actinopolymorpha rutila]NYH90773.1 nucleoside-diphosphate-sugar epimerase [Actinopolymorpha rutila]